MISYWDRGLRVNVERLFSRTSNYRFGPRTAVLLRDGDRLLWPNYRRTLARPTPYSIAQSHTQSCKIMSSTTTCRNDDQWVRWFGSGLTLIANEVESCLDKRFNWKGIKGKASALPPKGVSVWNLFFTSNKEAIFQKWSKAFMKLRKNNTSKFK